ncbi:MAG TPA: M23 family peptidase, partial [Phenylobacterium sp.]
MQEFDPRRPTFRLTPALAIGLAGVAALAVGWKLSAGQAAIPAPKPSLDPAAISALQHAAFIQSEAQPGFARPQSV